MPSGAIRYEVDFGLVGGVRCRRLVNSMREARAALAAERRRRAGLPPPAPGLTIQGATDKLLAGLAERGRAMLTLRGLRKRLSAFARAMDGRTLVSVRDADVRAYLQSFGGLNRRNNLRAIRQLFRHAVRSGWVKADPTLCIDADVARPEPRILTPGQVDALLAGAPARLVPYLAVGLFAGLRPGELEALDWSAVDLDACTILVMPETSKVRRARYVPVCPRLAAILQPLARTEGRVCPACKALRTMRAAACKAAGVVWSQDVMRHTYATARLATETAGMVALDMGTSEAMLTRHYRGLARRADYAGFFTAPPAASDPAKARGR
jgi:integrase